MKIYIQKETEIMLNISGEDPRVKIPATLHFIRLGYKYQSLKDAEIDFDTKIFINRMQPALSKINNKRFTKKEIKDILSELFLLMRNNDLGYSFYNRLIDQTNPVKLIDFDHPLNNDLAVVDELSFNIKRDSSTGSFRPDINILVNGIPLSFLEVKPPNNEGGIQQEFNRMLNKRLEKEEYKKFFNMIQLVTFSNNMEYENEDSDDVSMIRAGSFYSTPNGSNTFFSFFREDEPGYLENYPFATISVDTCKSIISDLKKEPAIFDTPEFQTNLKVDTPCNKFITSMYDKERFLFLIHYGFIYVKATTHQKHIMRYPQFFASRALLKRLNEGKKRGIIWHTQGSGKTELAAYCNRIIKDYYAKQNIITRFFFVVDRLELLTQDNHEFSSRYFSVTNVQSKNGFVKELNKVLPHSYIDKSNGEFVVVNIQKFEEALPAAKNDYGANIQRVFFIDEAHRSYSLRGTYFKNLILCDPNAIFIALTGTPLLSKKERSNLKFGDYIHKYFYDKSIADGYTLRIKKEKIDTIAKKDIKQNLQLENPDFNSASVFESDKFIDCLGKFIESDFLNFRMVNQDTTIGGMIVCRTNPQAKKMHEWFQKNSSLKTGLVISADNDPKQAKANKNNQNDFKLNGTPDILIVEFMLTTGYDVSRLKKMYLLRGPHAHNLLQTISRVNRPYKAPNGRIYHYGYITDFVDIEEEYDRTLNDYLKELEHDINDTDDTDNNSLSGLVVDVDAIRKRYAEYLAELKIYVDEDNLEKFSQRLSLYNKDTLHKIKRCLNGIKDCYTEFLLSNAIEDAQKIDYERIKHQLSFTQKRIDFINLQEIPVMMMNILSDDKIVEIVYEFIKTSISVLDLSLFDPTSKPYQDFTQTLTAVKNEIKKNKNKGDIKLISLDQALQKLFSMLNIQSIDDLDNLTDRLKEILKKAIAINKENERLASIYDGNYAFVKTYQDILVNHPSFDNKDIEQALKLIYGEIKDCITSEILIVQGRQGFIDETQKKVVKLLLKNGLYKKLELYQWMKTLLSDLYTNLQNYR